MRTAKNTYRRFIEFEERAADIYLRLASNFSPENPDVGGFWLDMALQEKEHAGLLQFCLAERMFSSSLPGDSDIRKFDGFFRKLERRAKDCNDVNGAFQLAFDLESSELDSIYCHLTTPLHPSMYLLKRKIASSPSNHIQFLANAAKKFGASDKLTAKLGSLKEDCPRLFS